ncbi:hypothetical protein Tco_0866544 [Tanacetum coccineum]
MIVGIEESRHGPSDAMHNPSQPFEFLSKETFDNINSTAVGDLAKIKNGNKLVIADIDLDQVKGIKHSASRLVLLNKNVIGHKAQVHVKLSNSDNHELLHHQRYSKSNKEVFFREIVSLRSILWEIVSLDEEEEVASFQDKYEHVGQKHKMIKKVKSI